MDFHETRPWTVRKSKLCISIISFISKLKKQIHLTNFSQLQLKQSRFLRFEYSFYHFILKLTGIIRNLQSIIGTLKPHFKIFGVAYAESSFCKLIPALHKVCHVKNGSLKKREVLTSLFLYLNMLTVNLICHHFLPEFTWGHSFHFSKNPHKTPH